MSKFMSGSKRNKCGKSLECSGRERLYNSLECTLCPTILLLAKYVPLTLKLALVHTPTQEQLEGHGTKENNTETTKEEAGTSASAGLENMFFVSHDSHRSWPLRSSDSRIRATDYEVL